METYSEPKALVDNPHYREQRRKCLSGLSMDMIDEPISGVISAINQLPYCFTLQCCHGHFVYNGQEDPHNLEPLPIKKSIQMVEWRIAYVAFCIENSDKGRKLMDTLQEVTMINTENIQFCSAEWFWERQVNSYALQVEPERFKAEDKAMLNYEEALKIEKVRNEFYAQLEKMLQKL